MNDLLSLLVGIMGPGVPLQRSVAKDGLIISTVFTSDLGFETAIIDCNGAHPVERYDSKEKALEGHVKWTAKITKLEKIMKLGYGDGIPAKKIRLKRNAKTKMGGI